ncbi:MAG: hypothetical protein MAGBODY4_00878 [Candidatus Marinimicrobia bacterium]|nr:hypothetical protein [Candidatus Neomarinimicrobiota bacterium]
MYGFCFIEIPTTDIKKSHQFYEQVFHWEVEDMTSMDYTTFTPEDGPSGGFRQVGSIPEEPGVIAYIMVEDIEEMLDVIAQHGGEIIKEKEKVADMGWEAHFADPCGVKLAIWQTREESEEE